MGNCTIDSTSRGQPFN